MKKNCVLYKTVGFLGKRWTLLILLELYRKGSKPKRFTQLKNELTGITPKMLSDRMKELEKEKLVSKKVDASAFPVKCEYALTKSGLEFIKVINDIKAWTLKWKVYEEYCSRTDCKNCF